MSSAPATRVLHVVGSLDRGGVETWLMHVWRTVARDGGEGTGGRARVQFDFLTESETPGAFDTEAEALGARIIRCPRPRGPFRDTRALIGALRAHGPFNVVHAHSYHRLGPALTAARRCGVPVRIAHAHNDTRAQRDGAPLRARMRLTAGERAVQRSATAGLACSGIAADALYGEAWRSDPAQRWSILPYQIDCTPFAAGDDAPGAGTGRARTALRAGLGIPDDALVVAHVGRFVPQKNHAHVLRITAALAAGEPRVHLLLIGAGPLEPAVREAASRTAMAERIHFAGVRPDVPALLRHAADCFFFPSNFEGLGLALVEAQAAGLPIVTAEHLPSEAIVVPELVHRVALESSHDRWLAALTQALIAPRAVTPAQALSAVRASDYDLARGCERLLQLYGA